MGLLVIADLARADLPWIVYWRYPEKYAANDVIQFLQQKPFEHRVSKPVMPGPQGSSLLDPLYSFEWAQHLFPYYNIQSLDIVSLPWLPKDLAAFETAFRPQNRSTLYRMARRWQLTNTRYLLGPVNLLQSLNDEFDPDQHRFQIARAFDLAPARPGAHSASASLLRTSPWPALDDLTAVFNTNGPYAIFEFTGALPRARLYSRWQVITNDQAALDQLAGPAFDPDQMVVVNSPPAAGPSIPSAGSAPNPGPGATVEFVRYAPKQIVLHTKADFDSLLLLNDRFDPQWSVTVDGKPATLLRCNYIMRGVQLAPGNHTVTFSFRIPIGLPFARLEVEPDTQVVSFVFHIPTGLPSYLTLAAYVIALLLLLALALTARSRHV